MPPTSAEYVLDKYTKGTVRFRAVDDDAAVEMVYVKRAWWASHGSPERIRLSLEALAALAAVAA